MLLSVHKKANTFKAKRLVEKGGSSYLNQVPWSPQQTIPDHRLYLSIQLQKFLRRTYSRFLHMSLCAWECVCVCESEWVSVCVCVCVWVCMCEWMSQCVCVCLSMWVSVFVRVRQVDKALNMFDQSFRFKRISLFWAPIGELLRWFRNS